MRINSHTLSVIHRSALSTTSYSLLLSSMGTRIRIPLVLSSTSSISQVSSVMYLSYNQRSFSILSQYQKGVEHLKRLPQQNSNNNTNSNLNIPSSSSSSLPSTDDTVNTTSLSTTSSPSSSELTVTDTPSTPLDMTQKVIRDLEHQGEIHDATMQIMEKSPEWQDYDAHVNYELNMIKARYMATKEPLTGARRAQLNAHLRATQQEVMEAHADAAVEQLLASLSPEEIEQLRKKLRNIDASVPVTNEEYYSRKNENNENNNMSIFDKEFQSALQDLSTFLSSVQQQTVKNNHSNSKTKK